MIGQITTVWTDIMEWVVTSIGSVQDVFYTNGNLTFMGTLAVITVAIGVAFLCIGVVQNFLKLRG